MAHPSPTQTPLRWRALLAAGSLTLLTLGSAYVSAAPAVHAASGARPAAPTASPSAAASSPSARATGSGTPSTHGTPSAKATSGTTNTVGVPSATPTDIPLKITGYAKRLPKPTVHRTNGYEVGAYYFSGWSHAQNNNLTPLLLSQPFRRFEPVIGWYDDSQAQVDRNIQQASAVGINFFSFDFYDTARSRYATDKTLNEALGYYLTSSQRYRMNFAVTFIDQAPFVPRAGEWPGLVKTWIALFRQPDYVRVNGKPLFTVFSPEHMREIFGSSKSVAAALAYLRSQAVKAGLPGVTIAVGATLVPNFNMGRVGQLRVEGYDVMTGYNYHAVGGEKYRKAVPYSRLVQENRQMWDRVARNIARPYIPVITSGWDQRFSYREQKTAIIYAGRTPSQFACYATAARRWVDANATRTVKEKIVMVFAWNEIGEGGHIIPTGAERYGYTDALHTAFTAHSAPGCR